MNAASSDSAFPYLLIFLLISLYMRNAITSHVIWVLLLVTAYANGGEESSWQKPFIFRVPSASMEPSIHAGSIVAKHEYAEGEPPQRGDIVIIKEPAGRQAQSIKRVIAIPRDKIKIVDQIVFVNGKALSEPYVKMSSNSPPHDIEDKDWWIKNIANMQEIIVPGKSYFLLGDNRNSSLDSRSYGCVPMENIQGKAVNAW